MKPHSSYSDYESAIEATERSHPTARYLPNLSKALTITVTTYTLAEIDILSQGDEPIAIGTPHPYRRSVYADNDIDLVYWVCEDGDGATIYTTTGIDAHQMPELQPFLLVMLYCVDAKLPDLKAKIHFPGIDTSIMPGAFDELTDCYLTELSHASKAQTTQAWQHMNQMLCRNIDQERRKVTLLAMMRGRWMRDETGPGKRSQKQLATLVDVHHSVVNSPIVGYRQHWRNFGAVTDTS
jgi:hypothetical protein